MITVLFALASAADVDRYPWWSEVALPAEGVVRVRVPAAMRTAADPTDGSDLLLVDATGRVVPFARVEGRPATREVAPVAVAATTDPTRFVLDAQNGPVDVLEVALPPEVPAAVVTVRSLAGAVLAGPTLVYDLRGGQQRLIELPLTFGRFEVAFEPTSPAPAGTLPPSFKALRRVAPAAPPERIEVQIGPPRIQENGLARYEIVLERPLPVDRVEVRTTGIPVEGGSGPRAARSVWEREAEVVALPWYESPDAVLGAELRSTRPVPIRRIALGGQVLELLTVPGPSGRATDRLALLVSTRGQPPLEVASVVLELDSVELLLLDPGPGPHALYCGAPAGTGPAWDLEVAAPDLSRMAASAVAVPGPVEPNPAWVPPEVRANLAGPGPELDPGRWTWRREVPGAGLVRVALPAEVLSTARPDLGDVRLVDAGGRQVPYVLRRRPVDPRVEGTTVDRSERGGRSILRVRWPDSGIPVSTVTLSTGAAVFERQVTVSRPRGTALEPLRSVSWVGRDRPMALAVEVGSALDDELVVEIDNGDDAPLPIGEVTVRATGWWLMAILPEGGASLLYGAPTAHRPSYDLGLLDDELLARASSEVVPGEREPVRPPALGAIDRAVLALGLVVLALGLLIVAADLVRRLPEPTT